MLKRLVSKKKRRYIKDGFDLDLAYITDRIIAMGFPAQGFTSLFRNKMNDVQKFLTKYHGGNYKVYNLCQKLYKDKLFEKVNAEFQFEDHHAPPFKMIKRFWEDLEDWLDADEKNVACVHCKAGKGRTGLMICWYLIYSGLVNTAEEALELYGLARTHDMKGVTIRSQIRYIKYFEQYLLKKKPKNPVFLKSITLSTSSSAANWI